MLNAILALGMETTFFRYLHKHEDRRSQVYSNSFFAIAISAGVFLLFTTCFADSIAAWIGRAQGAAQRDFVRYVKYFICILVVDALAVIPFAKIRVDGKPMRYGVIKLANILIFISGNFFFLFLVPYLIRSGGEVGEFLSAWYRPQWVGYVFISNLIASVFTLVLLLPELLELKPKYDRKLMLDMFIYSFPVLVANISFIINENIDKIFLGMFLPKSISQQELGIYGACCKLAIFLNIFIQAFRLGAEPFFFSHAKAQNAGQTYARIMNYFVIAVSLIFVALTANIEILKYFIKGNATQQALYWSGLRVVPILLFGYVSLGIYMNLSIWYKLSDQTRYALYISGVGAALTIVLNVVFIPYYSYVASAWASLIAYSSMMVLSYVLGQRNYPIPYYLGKNLAYLLAASVIVFLSYVVFDHHLIIGNMLLLLFMVATFYVERRELAKIKLADNPGSDFNQID